MHSAQKTRPTWKEMIQVFKDIVSKLDIAYLIMDALDECSEDVRDLLLSFFETLPSNTRLMVTTRHIEEITYGFRTSPMIEIRATVSDLKKYVASRIRRNRRLSGYVRSNGSLEQDICERVGSKAEGMFLAAKLHVDALSTKTNIKELKKALENLSTNINDLYDDAIARIESQNQDYRTLAEKALRWVAYAFRPLYVEVLKEAVAIELVESRKHKSDDEGIPDFNDEAIPSIGSILDVCAGLLIHDETSGLVRLVHYTAQDYFDAHAGSRFDKSHTHIARECVTYLSYKCFQNPEDSSNELETSELETNELETGKLETSENSDASSHHAMAGSVSGSSRSRYYYLYDYASAFWAQHATTIELPITIRQFLARNPRIILLTTSHYDLFTIWQAVPENVGFLEVRHGCEIAAFYGIHDELQEMCSRIGEAEVRHDRLNISLHLAVSNGQARSTEILLDYGANINSKDEDDRTALLTASRVGNLNLMHLLLDRGCDQDAHDQCGETALLRAVRWSHKSCVLALLDHGADINSKDSIGRTVLHEASISGDLHLLNLLLARGSNIDAKDRMGKTPLIKAAENLHEHCMLALIRHGADINVQDVHGLSALHIASANGTLTSVAELAKHCATISMRSVAIYSLKFLKSSERPSLIPYYWFHFEVDDHISYYGTRVPTLRHPEYLKSMLQLCESAEEARVWRDGVTALDLALLREHEEIIRLLRPLTPPKGEAVSVSFESYLLDLLEVASIEEARRELDVRIAGKAREEMAAVDGESSR
ncbi:MAG: hypothetical protein Q9198_002484 [Flavoplaca austrocitrina]